MGGHRPYMQRRLQIGYNRAATIEEMEEQRSSARPTMPQARNSAGKHQYVMPSYVAHRTSRHVAGHCCGAGRVDDVRLRCTTPTPDRVTLSPRVSPTSIDETPRRNRAALSKSCRMAGWKGHIIWIGRRLRFAYDDAHGGAIVYKRQIRRRSGNRARRTQLVSGQSDAAGGSAPAVETGIQPAMVVANETQEQLSLTLRDPKGDLPGTATLYFTGTIGSYMHGVWLCKIW